MLQNALGIIRPVCEPILFIMVGFPRSGKSTWIKENSNYLVVEPDWIRREILGHQFHKPAEPIIWLIADSFIRIALSQGQNVVLDGTNLLPFIREKYITLAKGMNASVIAIWVDTPMEVCVERNNRSVEGQKLPHNILVSKEEGFVPPSKDEGFDSIIVYRYDEENEVT